MACKHTEINSQLIGLLLFIIDLVVELSKNHYEEENYFLDVFF